MKKIFFLAFVIACLFSVNVHAQSEESIVVDGQTRTYLCEAPAGSQPPGGWPVLFMFHGAMKQGIVWFRLPRFKNFKDKALERGFYVIAPDGLYRKEGTVDNIFGNLGGPRWNTEDIPHQPVPPSGSYGNDDIDFINALMGEVAKQPYIDQEQMFFTGFSSGAGITMLSAMVFTTRIKAASINSGGYLGDLFFELPANGHPPMMVNHGKLDFVVNYESSVIYYEDLCDAGIEATLNLAILRGHNWLIPFNEDVLDWFDDHKGGL